jgi:hypothetical protein
MMIPSEVQAYLDNASKIRVARFAPKFQSLVCNSPWDLFIEQWAAVCYSFVAQAMGPYAIEPLPIIKPMADGDHSAGANASFQGNGQITLHPSVVESNPGATLEKLTHELTHAALADFPEGDPFYEEGFVDFSVWTMAHASIWGEHREAMKRAANFNIECRRDRALRDLSDYDRKRWAGGLFCSLTHGPWIVSRLKMRKAEGNLTW